LDDMLVRLDTGELIFTGW